MVDWKKFQGRPKTYLIGKDLPEECQQQVDIYPLTNDDLWMADMDEAKQIEGLHGEERASFSKYLLEKQQKMIATMTRSDLADVKGATAEVYEELLMSCMDRMNVGQEKQERMKRLLKKAKEKEEAALD